MWLIMRLSDMKLLMIRISTTSSAAQSPVLKMKTILSKTHKECPNSISVYSFNNTADKKMQLLLKCNPNFLILPFLEQDVTQNTCELEWYLSCYLNHLK